MVTTPARHPNRAGFYVQQHATAKAQTTVSDVSAHSQNRIPDVRGRDICLLRVFTRAAPRRWFRDIARIFDDRERDHRHCGRYREQADFRRDNTLPAEISTLAFHR